MIYTSQGARIGADGKYRYRLWREWRRTERPKERFLGDDERGRPLIDNARALFILLNPSTADGEYDDPTIRRCVGFADIWGYAAVDVVNLFAYRTKSPARLKSLAYADPLLDPVGPQNREYIERAAADADVIVCAWGTHGDHLHQDEAVLGWIDRHVGEGRTYCLAVTRYGHPQHPLYLPWTRTLTPYSGRRRLVAA